MQVLIMEKFRHRGKCKTIVIIEMILSAFSLGLFVTILVARYYHRNDDPERPNLYAQLFVEVEVPTGTLFSAALIILGYVAYIRVATNILILIVGNKVLNEACSLYPSERNLYRIGDGISACKFWCRLELFRLILVVISILLQLFLIRHLNIYRTYFDILNNMPALFGWLLGEDFLKELEIHHRDPNANNYVNNLNLCYLNNQNNNLNNDQSEEDREIFESFQAPARYSITTIP